jgi:hypothetical protein
MLLAGEERWSRYFLQRFHGQHWTREELGSFRAWEIPRILTRHASNADIVIARLDTFSTNLLTMPNFLRVPEWVRMVAKVPGSNKCFTSHSAKEDLRSIKKNGLSWRISHDPLELRRHLDRDYYPYTRLRHGEDAYVQPSAVLRKAFKDGGLLVVEINSQPVAGLIFEKRGSTMQIWTMACSESDESLLSKRAMAAVYAFSFEYARSTGLDFVDMRGCRPCPADSLFFVKQKWGSQVHEHGELAFEFLVHWHAANERVLEFLEKTPLIFRENENLSVIGTAQGEPKVRWREAGLSRFHALSPGKTGQLTNPMTIDPPALESKNRTLGRQVRFSE